MRSLAAAPQRGKPSETRGHQNRGAGFGCVDRVVTANVDGRQVGEDVGGEGRIHHCSRFENRSEINLIGSGLEGALRGDLLCRGEQESTFAGKTLYPLGFAIPQTQEFPPCLTQTT